MTTTFSRRSFLKSVAAATCGSCVHSMVSPLLGGTGYMAWAGPADAHADVLGAEPLLILVNLDGGCSYNATPIYNGSYYDLNPTISYRPETSTPLTGGQGLHPQLAGLKPIWDAGDLAILNLVGITGDDPNGLNGSHEDGAGFRLTGITDVKELRAGVNPGWVARLSAHFGEPFSGIAINSGRSCITTVGSNPALSITSLATLGEQTFIRQEVGDWMRYTRAAVLNADTGGVSPANTLIKDTMKKVDRDFARLGVESNVALPAIANPFDLSNDPQTFIQACQDAAKLLVARSLRVRFIYLELRGFDTHGEEKAPLTDLLGQLSRGLIPLIQTIKAAGRWNETVIATISEFARTHENGTGGSDHGAAAPMFVMGGAVNGGLKSPTPTSAQILAGDYFANPQVDFRHVFREIVVAMGLNPDVIFPYRVTPSSLGLF